MLGATPTCVRRRLWRAATAALTVAVVIGLFAGALADTANAGIFSDATSRLFGRTAAIQAAAEPARTMSRIPDVR